MKKELATALVLAAAMLELGLAQETATTMEERLNRQIDLIDESPLPVSEALVFVFRAANLPGGVALFRCGSSEPLVTIDQGTSVRAAFERVKSVRPELSLDPSSKEVLNILDQRIFEFLETRIPNLTITNPRQGGGSIREILSTPEARARLTALRLSEANTPLGISSIPLPGTRREPVPPLKLGTVTVRGALNVIALGLKQGVWVYEESGCSPNGERTFALYFAVK